MSIALLEETTATAASDEPTSGWFKSISFWLCLLIAAVLFGAVSLAPRVRDFIRLDHAVRQNQWELVRIEDRIEQLEGIARSLRDDTEFVSRLAQADLRAQEPNVQQIPVDEHLVLRPTTGDGGPPPPAMSLPIYLPILDTLADNRDVGNALLAVAAASVIFAFTYFQDATTDGDPTP
jgi:cell division protein FtsB